MPLDLDIVAKNIGKTLSNNSPSILSAMAVLGVFTTTGMAISATPIAIDILESEERFRKEEGNLPEIDLLDKIQLTWKIYFPTALSGLLTIVSIIGSNHISTRRNAAYISLLGMAEETLRKYQEKVIDTIGETKEERIRAEIVQDDLKRHPFSDSSIILTGKGDYLCFDNFSKRYFRSTIESVNRAVNEFNFRLNKDGRLNINTWFDLIGLDEITLGQEYGWDRDKSLMEIRITSKIAYDQDREEPCAVIDYRVEPYFV